MKRLLQNLLRHGKLVLGHDVCKHGKGTTFNGDCKCRREFQTTETVHESNRVNVITFARMFHNGALKEDSGDQCWIHKRHQPLDDLQTAVHPGHGRAEAVVVGLPTRRGGHGGQPLGQQMKHERRWSMCDGVFECPETSFQVIATPFVHEFEHRNHLFVIT
ncbi:hypothetical protein H257_00496 [Aphanomyces astaci]|uniref:Uncharacterized protein n=1 Tax=Aphanomyces astaci TaxID=112090 RepID=W4HAT7_APHAT|nr:hypothetical protein H257_00496 [Aphanomyces astaci]ETV89120.1 hypothetical protein H257_00496 [Aphanomyces astaci]|eukprot:XP_009821520.1 hypothetical protein H257_00496 [Aphanomyces astaci]